MRLEQAAAVVVRVFAVVEVRTNRVMGAFAAALQTSTRLIRSYLRDGIDWQWLFSSGSHRHLSSSMSSGLDVLSDRMHPRCPGRPMLVPVTTLGPIGTGRLKPTLGKRCG
ncbi:hypothetical protein [Crateriforma conspicua]|uniref:Uncharacterized protein n=1 Tax=Crateriforma conspicua TaxID=2527996 RepID=A0A5C6FSC1_9PLAN|nr:hypothetical protein [Crateriforma conspicua]TWU66062.1 hypothetical protein V7x_16190 [Crateriforma conspicua]